MVTVSKTLEAMLSFWCLFVPQGITVIEIISHILNWWSTHKNVGYK